MSIRPAWAPKADTLIVMDAPPGKEDIAPYLKVSSLLEQAGAHVPHVHASDAQARLHRHGRPGRHQYLVAAARPAAASTSSTARRSPRSPTSRCAGLRAHRSAAAHTIAQPLERELNLMPEWFLAQTSRARALARKSARCSTVTFEFLINEALLQPQVFVHRDFHSRNLMVLPTDNKGGPGVIDFQDALRGPIGYDLVSLLKDCYISWSRERVERLGARLSARARQSAAPMSATANTSSCAGSISSACSATKVLGIFARLWHRDGKIGYLADLPLTSRVRARCLPPLSRARWNSSAGWRGACAPQLAPATARQKEKPRRVAGASQAQQPKRKSQTPKAKVAAKKKLTARVAARFASAKAQRQAPDQRAVKRGKRAVKTRRSGASNVVARKLTARRRRTRRLTQSEGHGSRRGTRRTHASADRCAAQTAVARWGQSASSNITSNGCPPAGFREVVINTALVRRQDRERARHRRAVRACHNLQPRSALKPSKTGGGIFNALPLLGSAPFLLVNGDVWTDIDFGALRRDPPAALALAPRCLVPNPPQHAARRFPARERSAVRRRGSRQTYSGVGIFPVRSCLPAAQPGKFPLLPLLRQAIAERALSGELHAGRWYDIGTTEQARCARMRS